LGKTDVQARRLYARSVLSALATGASQPFIAVYAVLLGATSSQVGVLHAVNNLAANALQPLWGFLSDRSGARIKPIVLSTLASSALWVPVLIVKDAAMYISIVSVQLITSSVSAPLFTTLVSEVIPAASRSAAVAALNLWGQAGSLISTLSLGLASLLGLPGYMLGFSLAAASGAASAIVLWGMRDPPRPKTLTSELTIPYIVRHIILSRHFLRFTAISNLYGFYMSLAWPCFTITMVRIANFSFFQIALFSVVSGVSGMLFASIGRGVLDGLGDVRSIAIFRAALSSIALTYAFLPSFEAILAVNIVAGIANVSISVTLLLLLLRYTSVEDRGTFTAVYNLLQGLSFFFGSLIGGQLIQQLEREIGLHEALRIVLTISAVGRLVFGLLHFHLPR